MFRGSIPALITPFKNGAIDYAAFDNFVEWQIDQGSHGVVACGTTGESPTLSREEHNTIVERTVALVKQRIPVIAGTGTNSTASTIESTLHAQKAGADAALIVTPYYNKPTQEGLYAHYKAIHDATDIPIIIYNIPARSIVDMGIDTMSRLAELPRIVGVKDATADLNRPQLLRNRVGSEFCQLSGEDGTALAFLASGGHGCISVAANVTPSLCARLQDAWVEGQIKECEDLRDRLTPLNKALFFETSPAPVKYACASLGLCSEDVRLPMLSATPAARAAIDSAMAFAGITKGAKTQKTRAAG
ncbi:MAG: 4-hydroxy-tetrahydrodipicolinate synthase [Micavibrio sp.]